MVGSPGVGYRDMFSVSDLSDERLPREAEAEEVKCFKE